MAAVAGNSRSKMRDLDRHGERSTQTPVRLRGPCTQSDVQRGSVLSGMTPELNLRTV
jgi:hypothetical protein